ncbi:MAG TPA: hypothetical protein VG537_04965 [Candidatus Kapabacteria bacterium]|nr:hypothetical protein [Candidatus Kapabacteria bacterium]
MSALTVSCTTSTDTGTTDTIHLVASPATVALTSTTTIDTVQLRLSCGCPFQLKVAGTSSDDTSFIVTYPFPMDFDTTPHPVTIQAKPTSKGQHSAWILYSAVDHYNVTDYDTLHLNSNLP